MKKSIITLFLAAVSVMSCESPMPPSDEEMIRHFATHEAAFRGLRSRRNIRITEHGDLNEIYRRTYNDTTLYKPVKGDWYIELDHSR